MGLAEEEVLIRDDSGLLLDVSETRVRKSQEWSKKLMKTCCLSLGFLALGLCVAIPGPTLLDLEDQVKATTFQMMVVFVSRSLGYLLGALLGGVLFDCFDKQLLMFCTLLLSSVATIAIPWSLTMVVMATMFALQGVTMGALDTVIYSGLQILHMMLKQGLFRARTEQRTNKKIRRSRASFISALAYILLVENIMGGGNVLCIQLWGKKNPPFMQTIHFAFGIGAFVAPLLAKPFLSHVDMQQNATSIVQGNIPVSPFLTNNLYANITKRSVDTLHAELSRPSREFYTSPYRLEHNNKKDKSSKTNFQQSMEFFDHLKPFTAFPGDFHVRLKRNSGDDDDDGYTGMWRWKRQHHESKRQVSSQIVNEQNDGTIATSSVANKTKGADINSVVSDYKPGGLEIDSSNTDTVTPDHLKEKDNKESDQLVQVNETDLKLSLGKTAAQNINISEITEVKSNVTVKVNGTDSDTNTTSTTLSTTPMTSEFKSEEKFHKPSAATDSDRKPDTADGKPIAKHLEEHKDEIPNVKDDPGTTKIVQMSTNVPDKGKPINETTVVDNNSVADQINITSANNTGQVNIAQGSSKENSFNTSGHKDSTKIQITVSTLRSDKVNDTAMKMMTSSLSTQSTSKLNLNTTKSKPTTAQSSRKLITTSLPPQTRTSVEETTIKTTTSEKTTATTKKVTTSMKKTTTEKSTTTSEKVKTTMKLTPVPTKTTESSTRKTTQATKQSTPLKTDEATVKIMPTPETVGPNSTGSVVSVTNTSIVHDKQSTTEVSMKPQSAVDSFLNNAIHAVKNISKIQFAYLSIGVALFLIAILFLVLYCTDKKRLTADRDLDELERFKTSVTCAKAGLIFLLGVFFFCYMGLEVTFGALVTTFAVDFNNWPKEQGAMAAAIFWGSLATGRGLSIFFSRCCGPKVMLLIDMIFMIIGGLVLSIGVHFYDKLLWLGTLILGLGMSSAFPAGISWAQKYFHLTGKSTAVFVIGSALGQMIVPVFTGYFYEYMGSIILMYTTLVISITILIIFIFMQCIVSKRGVTLQVHERNGFLPLEDVDEHDETMEMDDYLHFDKSQARKKRDKRGGGDAEYHTLISDLDDD